MRVIRSGKSPGLEFQAPGHERIWKLVCRIVVELLIMVILWSEVAIGVVIL